MVAPPHRSRHRSLKEGRQIFVYFVEDGSPRWCLSAICECWVFFLLKASMKWMVTGNMYAFMWFMDLFVFFGLIFMCVFMFLGHVYASFALQLVCRVWTLRSFGLWATIPRKGMGQGSNVVKITSYSCSYSWWKKSDVHQLRLVVNPIIYKVLYIRGGCLGFFPSTDFIDFHTHTFIATSTIR